jgi:predicted metalloprotease with PDZ domain
VKRYRSFVFAALVLLAATPAGAQALEPIRYTLSFPAPHTHYIEVEAVYPTEGRSHVDLMMAVWTPGSYLIREYARHVESLAAREPERGVLAVEKTRKNRWRVTTDGAQHIIVRYRVYAHELSVRTNWVDEELAVINGAPTFITLLDARPRAHDVRVVLPAGWSQSVSGLPHGTAMHSYRAMDYDTLVDSPILAGNPAVYEFTARGRPHYLVDFREQGVWKGRQAVQDLAKVVEAGIRLWGEPPYDRYYFFNVIGGPNQGLEHRNSTLIFTDRTSTDSRPAYLRWLSYASHEFLHAWNIKRLRPIELGPFDYENEVHTRSLWFAEGVTDYYADLQIHRAGISTRDEYIAGLGGEIRTLQTTPGRLVQSVEQASYDAWIKYYRPDENSANTSISYYVKGLVIGFLLDAKIRRMTAGARALDDLMRMMYSRFSGATGFTPEDLRSTAGELVGPARAGELGAWFRQVLETTEELNYGEALDWFGLRLSPAAERPRAWLGVTTGTDGQRTFVSEIRRGSPGFAAGLAMNDEIVSIDGKPLAPAGLAARLEELAPGTTVSVRVSRRNVVSSIAVTLQRDPSQQWSLSIAPSPSPEQAGHLKEWLGP